METDISARRDNSVSRYNSVDRLYETEMISTRFGDCLYGDDISANRVITL